MGSPKKNKKVDPKFKVGDRVNGTFLNITKSGIIKTINRNSITSEYYYKVEENGTYGYYENELELDNNYYFNEKLNKIIEWGL